MVDELDEWDEWKVDGEGGGEESSFCVVGLSALPGEED